MLYGQVDRLYKWDSVANSPIQDAMARQPEFVRKEFDTRYNQVRTWGGLAGRQAGVAALWACVRLCVVADIAKKI